LRQYKLSGTALITAATVNVGTIDMEAALDRGAAREPNHWSAAIPMLSSTNIASIAPVTSIPQGLRLQVARADVISSGSQIARSCTYTGLVSSPVSCTSVLGSVLKTAGMIEASQA